MCRSVAGRTGCRAAPTVDLDELSATRRCGRQYRQDRWWEEGGRTLGRPARRLRLRLDGPRAFSTRIVLVGAIGRPDRLPAGRRPPSEPADMRRPGSTRHRQVADGLATTGGRAYCPGHNIW